MNDGNLYWRKVLITAMIIVHSHESAARPDLYRIEMTGCCCLLIKSAEVLTLYWYPEHEMQKSFELFV